jgi:hypothetical protein
MMARGPPCIPEEDRMVGGLFLMPNRSIAQGHIRKKPPKVATAQSKPEKNKDIMSPAAKKCPLI